MTYSDTTNKNGIIQRIEQYTGLGDGAISGNTTLLKIITAQVNEAFDDLMPLMLSATRTQMGWDDINNTGEPIGTIDLTQDQPDYTIATDANSLDILDIKKVQILQNSSATIYLTLDLMQPDEWNAPYTLSPHSTYRGIPTRYIRRGNTIFLDPCPNYSATNGIKIFFERIESYFASSDTTKTPGIPRIFHPLLPKIAAYNWLLINKPANTVLIQGLAGEIVEGKRNIEAHVRSQFPTRPRLTMEQRRFR